MPSIAFIDTEISTQGQHLLDMGSIKSDGSTFHENSLSRLAEFLQGVEFVCGHNIFHHDLKHLKPAIQQIGLGSHQIVDTLFWSPLLFPANPYHALLKDDKLQTEDNNNPLNDSIKARDLFFDEVAAFQQLDKKLKIIYYHLLKNQPEFQSFFRFNGYTSSETDLEALLQETFKESICQQANLAQIIQEHPVELAYCLSLIYTNNRYSITPPWVLKNYPHVERILTLLRNRPCLEGCHYCEKALDIHLGLRRFFGFTAFRTYGGETLQESAVEAALSQKSLLAVFPTGGGKSLTFQLPALMSGENSKGLTVVISPLQALMKDQVDNLEKEGIAEAVTINGLLDPIERAKSFERVENGSASLLYISPESLRSRSIERLLLGRNVVRFVVDEAHCLSAWGHDFRVDYLYIGDFIKSLQTKKNLREGIPISCFTATAKQQVVADIREYFQKKLSLELEIYASKASRTNLSYTVIEKAGEDDKYLRLRDLIQEKQCPAIVYVSRTRQAFRLAKRLSEDGFPALPYHGKMEKQEKTANQNAFVSGDVSTMVATSAFGMGVDKSDVGMVVHFDISDSLENYIQEAGRAGRDQRMEAECYVLFSEDDLAKHFVLLNQTRLSQKEIQQVWKAIKVLTRFRPSVSVSALELARKSGWNDNVQGMETRVTTAISALEEAGYVKRGQNVPRVFANSILTKNAQEAIDKINASERFQEKEKLQATRIIKKLFSSKSRKHATGEAAESRVDYISDHLGIVKYEVIKIISLLREENILADNKDLTAFIKKGEGQNRSLQIAETFAQVEKFLFPLFSEEAKAYHLKELNEQADLHGVKKVSPSKLKTLLNFWAVKHWLKRESFDGNRNHFKARFVHNPSDLKEKLEKRHTLATFLVEFLYQKSTENAEPEANREKPLVLVEFSVHELKTAYEQSQSLFKIDITLADIEDTLFYLSRIGALQLEGGFLVTYNALQLERLEPDPLKRYTKEDHKKLALFYKNKVQQIHIVGEYAHKMISNYQQAQQYVEDYFHLNYSTFLRKYFPGGRADDLNLNITPAKYKQLFGELSKKQLEIIRDSESKYIVVAAGPGSGKTRVLVHKLASLLLMEDVKHEQLLMVTFSRAAVTEFKTRLLKLIGNAAHYIEIKTFHSYCFDLLGKVGNLEKSDEILKKTIERLKSGDVEINRVTKTVLVIDEAQDMDADEFALVKTLMELNDEMRVIAVGDDDQNIYEFRGASSKHLQALIEEHQAKLYELVENYRSKSNLVDFTNLFAQGISQRLKRTPIVAQQTDLGTLKVVRYQSTHLLSPVVDDVLNSYLSGSTAILTRTNQQASQLTGLLLRRGMPAKLIQTNDGFSLYNLAEIRFFLNQLQQQEDAFVISDDVWRKAKRELNQTYKNSTQLGICQQLISDFETTHNQVKYHSDFEVFVRESKLEDFASQNGETVFVSTIHKAKGREFDNVFLLLENAPDPSDSGKRQLYVAMTRAKQHLAIHLNTPLLNGLTTESVEWVDDRNPYQEPNELAHQLTYKDVWLDYFINQQHLLQKLIPGTTLLVDENGCLTHTGKYAIRFSKKFKDEIAAMQSSGYAISTATVNFVLHWQKEDTENEILVALPQVGFERVVRNE